MVYYPDETLVKIHPNKISVKREKTDGIDSYREQLLQLNTRMIHSIKIRVHAIVLGVILTYGKIVVKCCNWLGG